MKSIASPQVRAVHRVLDILECLAAIPAGASVSEVARKVGLHVSTAHRLLGVLKGRGYVEQDVPRRAYRIGPEFLKAGSRYLATFDLPQIARPHLERLRDQVQETIHLAVYTQGEVMELVRVFGGRASAVATVQPGARYPAYCTALGKVLLAHRAPEEFGEFLATRTLVRHTRRTITTPARLRAELSLIRRARYAVDRGEMDEDLYCVAVPVWGPDRRIRAALSMALPRMRFRASKVPAWVKLLQEASRAVSHEWGFVAD